MIAAVLRDALLVAGKDLRLERRSKVALGQMLPFAMLVLLLFAFALDPDRGVLEQATAGLFWMTVLFTAVLAVQRSFAVELEEGVLDALRLTGIPPAAVYLGKVMALVLELFALEIVLGIGVAVLYDARLEGWGLLVVVLVAATVGIAAAGVTYGILAARLRQGSALLPILLLPLLAPVLIAATRGSEVALRSEAGGGWSWASLLGVFAVAYLALGTVLFKPLLDET
ncbi:MAG: ABC transporter permease [Actinomycetia bacterium]|nr:ABC transporter permease [Actinomycetes bacterium]